MLDPSFMINNYVIQICTVFVLVCFSAAIHVPDKLGFS